MLARFLPERKVLGSGRKTEKYFCACWWGGGGGGRGWMCFPKSNNYHALLKARGTPRVLNEARTFKPRELKSRIGNVGLMISKVFAFHHHKTYALTQSGVCVVHISQNFLVSKAIITIYSKSLHSVPIVQFREYLIIIQYTIEDHTFSPSYDLPPFHSPLPPPPSFSKIDRDTKGD
jgi:hypothetical protein